MYKRQPHTIKGLAVGKKYRLHEKEAPLGYAQAKDVYFTIENTEKVQSVAMRDIQVKVRKVDEAGKALANAKFIVTDTKTKQLSLIHILKSVRVNWFAV